MISIAKAANKVVKKREMSKILKLSTSMCE